MLGEHLSETIGSFDEIVDFRTGHGTTTAETETFGVVNVGSETELAGSFTGNSDGVTSQHLNGQTEGLGFVDSLSGIVTGRVGARHDSENFPGSFATLTGDTQGTETTGGELGDLVLVGGVDFLGDGVVFLDGLENEKWSTLDTDDALALRRLNDGADLLGDRIEGVEVEDLVLGEDALGAGVVLERLEESLVNGVDTLLLAGSSETGSKHEVFRLDTGDGVRLGERKLVLGKSTGLVGAENLDTGKGLNGRELLDDSLLLGKVSSADSHGGGDDGRKTDRDTNNGDGQSELKDGDDGVRAVE